MYTNYKYLLYATKLERFGMAMLNRAIDIPIT